MVRRPSLLDVVGLEPDTPVPVPPWSRWRQIQDRDGIWHRQIFVLVQIVPIVHDEMAIQDQAYTGCGLPLTDEDLGRNRDDSAALTCVICASGVMGDGDRLRIEQKHRLFGTLYGSRMPNLQNIPAKMVTYAKDDAETTLDLFRPRKPKPFATLRRFLGRLVR